MPGTDRNDQRPIRDGIVDDRSFETEYVEQKFRGNDLFGGDARSDDGAVAHHDQMIAVSDREIEVVQHHHHGAPHFLVELIHQVEDFHRVREVQIGSRFVEKQNVGSLGESHRDPGSLALTAGQLIDRSIGEIRDTGQLQRFGDLALVVRGPLPDPRLVRVAPT